MKISFKGLMDVMKGKNYTIYTENYQLNIVGIRRIVPTDMNMFDDLITVFFTVPSIVPWRQTDVTELFEDKISKRIWVFNQFPATTEPGKPFLLNPVNPAGTAILCEGQYIDVYKRDLHNNKYLALCQRLGEVEVWRDDDKDTEYDFKKKQKGFFGINIHRASQWKLLRWIDKNSAGCQVIQNNKHFDLMMNWTKIHEDKFGNKFSYTLINEKDFQ